MHGAASGNSTLGIPRGVGSECGNASLGSTGVPQKVGMTPHTALLGALKRKLMPKMPSEQPSVDTAGTPPAVNDGSPTGFMEASGPSEQDKMLRHKTLMVKAPTLASRAVHRKLFNHHAAKLNAPPAIPSAPAPQGLL